MNFIHFIRYLLIVLISTAFLLASAQETNEEYSKYISKIDSIYGIDDILVNGSLYFPKHPLAQGNPYLISDEWNKGSIYIKGKTYDDIELKYDLALDKLILRTKLINDKIPKVLLNNELVDSFKIGNQFFINTKWIDQNLQIEGFAELIYNNDIVFFIKFRKEYIAQFSENNQYGKYSQIQFGRYLWKDGVVTKVSTRKSLLRYFEENKKEIKKYLRKHHIKYKKANSKQLFDLINYCNELSSE